MFQPSKDLVIILFLSLQIDFTVGTCFPACVLCSDDTCMECDVGNYLESGSCYTCPAHCNSCNNSMVCYNCTEGYYGLSCDKNCSLTCFNKTCNKDSGICLPGCVEGYFPYGSSCYPCATGCMTCANFSNNSLECKEGYYGSSCQYPCSPCKNGICNRDNCTYGCDDGFYQANGFCNPCNKNCVNCSQYDNCNACKNGFFGRGCQLNCNECSPCNKNGSCHTTTDQQLSTEPTSPSKQSVITSFQTTTKATKTDRQPTITKESTSYRKQSLITSFQTTTIATTTDLQATMTTDLASPSKQSAITSFPTTIIAIMPQEATSLPNNTLIIYAAIGGGGGLVVIVLVIVVVVVRKRRGRPKQSDTVVENIDMTENENYISADDIDDISRNATNAQKKK